MGRTSVEASNAWFGEAFEPELQDAEVGAELQDVEAPAGPAASVTSSSPTPVASAGAFRARGADRLRLT